MSHQLRGKVVLVTGVARGIGAQTAREVAARGAKVALVGLEPGHLKPLAAELGADCTWFEADVTDMTSLRGAVDGTVATLGGIDVVVANAGVAPYGTVRNTDLDSFVKTVDVNLNGTFRTVRAALPHVTERQGYVLVVSSLSAFAPTAGMVAYTASKAGAEAFASALHDEVAHLGVAVGSAHPSWIDTDLIREASHDLEAFRAMRQRLPWPMRSTTTVEECGRAFADAVERRARRVYVPRSIMLVHWLRNLTTAKLASRLTAPALRELVPRLEAETAPLGRSFSARNHALQLGGTPSELEKDTR